MNAFTYAFGAFRDMLPAVTVSVHQKDGRHRRRQTMRRVSRRNTVLFLQGIVAWPHAAFYQPLISELEDAGCKVLHSPLSWLWYHFGALTENVNALRTFVEENDVRRIVGHSFGGVVAAHLHAVTGIPAVAIASPLLYTPLRDVQRYFGLALDERWKLETLHRRLSCECRTSKDQSLLSICSNSDRIVPKDATRIPGVNRLERRGRGHAEIVLHPRLPRDILEFLDRAKPHHPCFACKV